MTSGDPLAFPEQVFSKPILEKQLHKNQIWYDLREWRGGEGNKVRDAEDEIIRLALDILEVDKPDQADIVALWQREASRRARRTAYWITTGAISVIIAASVAMWQFTIAKQNAEKATASAITRTASALTQEDPLRAVLVLKEIDISNAPDDFLGVAHKMLTKNIPVARLRGHTKAIADGVFIGTNKIVSASSDGKIYLWSVDGVGDPTMLNNTPENNIINIDYSPQSSNLTVITNNGLIWFQNFTKTFYQTCNANSDLKITDIKFDGSATVALGYSKTLFLCTLVDGHSHLKSFELSEEVIAISSNFLPEGALAITKNGQAWLLPWQIDKPKSQLLWPLNVFEDNELVLTSATFSDNHNLLAIATNNCIAIFKIAKGKILNHIVTKLGAETPKILKFSPDGTQLAIITSQWRILRIETSTGSMDNYMPFDTRDRFIRPDENTSTDITSEGIDIQTIEWSPDSSQLAAIHPLRGIFLWPIASAHEPEIYLGHKGASQIIWSEDSLHFASLGNEGIINLWGQHSNKNKTAWRIPNKIYSGDLNSVASHFFIGTDAGSVWFGNISTYQMNEAIKYSDFRLLCPNLPEEPLTVHLLALANDDAVLWTVLDEGSVIRWSLTKQGILHSPTATCTKTQQERFVFNKQRNAIAWINENNEISVWDGLAPVRSVKLTLNKKINRIEFSKSGNHLGVAFDNGEVGLWKNLWIEDKFDVWQAHNSSVLCVAIRSEDAATVSTSTNDNAKFWLTQNNKPDLFPENKLNKWLTGCGLDNNEKKSVITSEDGLVWIWDLENPKKVEMISTPDGSAQIGLTGATFSPNNNLLVTGGLYDGKLRIWNKDNKELNSEINFLGQAITNTTFSQNGNRLLATGENGLIRVLPTKYEIAIYDLEQKTNATLTPIERETLLGENHEVARHKYETQEKLYNRTPLPKDWHFVMPF